MLVFLKLDAWQFVYSPLSIPVTSSEAFVPKIKVDVLYFPDKLKNRKLLT